MRERGKEPNPGQEMEARRRGTLLWCCKSILSEQETNIRDSVKQPVSTQLPNPEEMVSEKPEKVFHRVLKPEVLLPQ